MVSGNGGVYPRWNGTGDELFYVEGNTMMVAKVKTDPSFSVELTQALFTGDQVGTVLYDGSGFFIPSYDVTPDGQRFVVVQNVGEAGEASPTTLTVVLNWFAEFKDQQR